MADFHTAAELLRLCERGGAPLSRVMIEREIELFETDEETARARMAKTLGVMRDAVDQALRRPQKSMGGLIGGEAAKIFARLEAGETVAGSVLTRAVAYSVGVLEVNASMGLIVAAPTAGASGVVPGVLLALADEHGFSDEALVDALFNTAAVGYLFMRNATVSGARGGCQAEVGTASAMAASAVVELSGGSAAMCLSAASMAIGNVLGVVCDPIAGLVEEPCQKRNAMGAANALAAAEIALAGITPLVNLDEAAEAMLRVGRSMPRELRETALGGLAATPSACAFCGPARQ